jgi:hypothetical protein
MLEILLVRVRDQGQTQSDAIDDLPGRCVIPTYRRNRRPKSPDRVAPHRWKRPIGKCPKGLSVLNGKSVGATIAPMVVTGIPGHGKSTRVLNLLVNLAKQYGWTSAVFSPDSPTKQLASPRPRARVALTQL